MFITVTCSEEKMFYHYKNESQKLRIWIFRVCVRIPANSRTSQDL